MTASAINFIEGSLYNGDAKKRIKKKKVLCRIPYKVKVMSQPFL